MNILLIEDDQHKSSQISNYLDSVIDDLTIVLKKSYQSGLKEIILGNYDLILLDMQLPNFDIQAGEDGYKFRKTAGLDILEEIERKKIQCKVIVVTQFETFGEGKFYIDLNDLQKILESNFRNIYINTVFYSPQNNMWQSNLINLINDFNFNC